MLFEPKHLYHIYNQGNNRQHIFFSRENYLFFLKKIKEHILPHADILAWCLMPNHFHLMVYVKEIPTIECFTSRETLNKLIPSEIPDKLTLNDAIGIMLRSYTRAINKQENRTGSLFRKKTKSECITKYTGITPSFINSYSRIIINIYPKEKEYPKTCFDYIHNNPVKAGLVEAAENWEFSSFIDYLGKRNGKIVNKQRALEFLEFRALDLGF